MNKLITNCSDWSTQGLLSGRCEGVRWICMITRCNIHGKISNNHKQYTPMPTKEWDSIYLRGQIPLSLTAVENRCQETVSTNLLFSSNLKHPSVNIVHFSAFFLKSYFWIVIFQVILNYCDDFLLSQQWYIIIFKYLQKWKRRVKYQLD